MGLLTVDEAERMLREYKAGVPLTELCETYGIAKGEFRRLRMRAGVPPRRQRRAYRVLEEDDLAKLRRRLGTSKRTKAK